MYDIQLQLLVIRMWMPSPGLVILSLSRIRITLFANSRIFNMLSVQLSGNPLNVPGVPNRVNISVVCNTDASHRASFLYRPRTLCNKPDRLSMKYIFMFCHKTDVVTFHDCIHRPSALLCKSYMFSVTPVSVVVRSRPCSVRGLCSPRRRCPSSSDPVLAL